MIARQAEIEDRLATLPIREADARAEALRRNPERPAVDDELLAQVTGERVELERELVELAGNIQAAERVIGEASAAAEAETRAEAVAQAQAFREEEAALWAETVKAWKAVTASYDEAPRPSARGRRDPAVRLPRRRGSVRCLSDACKLRGVPVDACGGVGSARLRGAHR